MFTNVGDGEDKYKVYCKNKSFFYENLLGFFINFFYFY